MTSNGSFHMFKGSKSKQADESKRKQIHAEFQQVVAEQLPVFFLVNPISLQAVRNRVENVEYSAVSRFLLNVSELRLKGKGW